MKFISANNGLRVLFYSLTLASFPCSALARAHASPLGAAYFQQTITGTVSDSSGPLPGVIVAVKGTLITAISDASGHYSIAAGNADVIVFSFVGYKTQELPVGGRLKIDVILDEDPASLQEVVINAGYYSVKQKESTGSISRITAADIEKQPVTNVLATMQGRMAGVDITQDGGTPGGAFQIQIRGTNSLRQDGNQPLYIIDGVPYSSQSIGSPDTSTSTASFTSPLNSINPSDIQSIEVLKDADATAIYGSRGANGVVLVTTKKGKAGKLAVEVNASTAFGTVTRMMDLMKTPEYLALRRRAFLNDGITTYPDNAYDVNGTWDQTRSTDWQKKLIGGTATINNTQLSLSGGSETTHYLLSGTYRTETMVIPGDFQYDKGAVHFQMEHASPDDRFSMSLTAGYTSQVNDLPSTDLTPASRSLVPNAPELYDGEGNLNWEGGTFENPLAGLQSKASVKTADLFANTMLRYRIWGNLQARVSLGYTQLGNNEERTLPSTMYNPGYGIGSSESILLTNHTTRNSWIAEPQIQWTGELRKMKIDLLAGATLQSQESSQLYQLGYGFSSNALIYDMASAREVYVTGNADTQYRYQAAFGRVNVNWDGRYLLNLTGRRDGSSRFGPGRQFATFGAVGTAWIFSEESFLKDNGVLSFGKLRASYGTTGNDQIGDYQFLDTYASSGVPYQGIIGLAPQRLFNPDFSWEVNKKLEVAIETSWLNDRLAFSLAWYRNRSSNQLVGIPLPGTTGFTSITANLGATVQNEGLEATLSTVNLKGSAFKWTTDFNISASKNKLLAFPGLESSVYSNTFIIGQPLNIVRMYRYTGLDPESGTYTFMDYDGDGTITAAGDRKYTADLTPDFFGGLQNSFQYKNWALDFLFQFVKRKNYNYIPNGTAGLMYNQPAGLSSWQQQGDTGPGQVATTGTNGDAVNAFYRYAESSAIIVDGSFIRLKNISLAYQLPETTMAGLHCRIYFQGQNLLTITPYKGGDPEFKYTGYLPPLKVYALGVQLTF